MILDEETVDLVPPKTVMPNLLGSCEVSLPSRCATLMVIGGDDVVKGWDNEQSKCRSDGHSRYQDNTDAVAGFRTRTDHHHQREMPENRGG